MNITLVFPPRTTPTYAPLGLACLAAAAGPRNGRVALVDANLELWNRLCDTDVRLRAMRDFSHGALTRFLNPVAYAENWGFISEARRRINALEIQARRYVNTGELDRELLEMLTVQARRIAENSPETVGFSVMYLDQLPFALAAARYLNSIRSGCRILFGGAAMSALAPEALLKLAGYVDFILVGEGEIPFAALLDGKAYEQLPGCYYRSGGGVAFSGRPAPVPELAGVSMPDFSGLALNEYFNPVPVLPIYGCRGCKWRRCRFCTHNHSFGLHRERPPRAVALEMMNRRISCGCRHFYIVDQYVPPDYLSLLCDAILEMEIDCRFEIMARTIPEYTPELLEKAARAGCCWISWGMESGSQRLLDVMNKGTRVELAETVIHHAAGVGISNLVMMIYGAPTADRASMEETFSFLERVWPDIDGMTASAFVLFDHTAFGNAPGRYGLEVLGRNPTLEIAGQPIFDQKLRFRRTGEPGRAESPLAAVEIAEWERRKVWLPPPAFHGQLCCEHYLLYADAQAAGSRPCPQPCTPRSA